MSGFWLYALRRLLFTIPQLIAVSVIVFFLIRLLPGDPTYIVRSEWAPGDGEFILYVVEGGGHAWPGGGQFLPPAAIGYASQVDATPLIWQDFMAGR